MNFDEESFKGIYTMEFVNFISRRSTGSSTY